MTRSLEKAGASAQAPVAGAPDLQEWVAAAGGYPRIDWPAWDRAVSEWREGLGQQCDYLITPIKNSAGMILHPYGLQNSGAAWFMFVCFDSHKEIGRRMHLMEMGRIQMALVTDRFVRPTFGSSTRCSAPETGAGHNYAPKQFDAKPFPITANAAHDGLEIGARGVLYVKDWLNSRGTKWRDATRAEQHNGIDVVLLDRAEGMEIKARGETKDFPRIFVQTHECNPDRLYD